MAVGARDHIDKLLVQKYAQEKVDNHEEDALVSRVSADDIRQLIFFGLLADFFLWLAFQS